MLYAAIYSFIQAKEIKATQGNISLNILQALQQIFHHKDQKSIDIREESLHLKRNVKKLV